MFASRYFAKRYFAARYWQRNAGVAVVVVPPATQLSGGWLREPAEKKKDWQRPARGRFELPALEPAIEALIAKVAAAPPAHSDDQVGRVETQQLEIAVRAQLARQRVLMQHLEASWSDLDKVNKKLRDAEALLALLT